MEPLPLSAKNPGGCSRRGSRAGARIAKRSSGLNLHDVRGLFPLLTFHRLEFDDLALAQGTKAFRLNGRVMYEELFARFLLDESVSFRLTEPFDRSAMFQLRESSFRSGMVARILGDGFGVNYVLTPLGVRTAWKQSRQYTGLPGVGRNGTWVVTPHDEHTAS